MEDENICYERVIRTVSLVVSVIDDFTGKPIFGSNARVWIEGEKPPIKKNDGWFVFVNLKQGQYVVCADGGVYNKVSVSCNVSGSQYAELKLRLMPNRSYAVTSGTTFIEGKAPSGNTVRVYCCDKAQAYKLLSDAKKKANEIGIYHPEGVDVEGKLLLVMGDNGENEYIRVSGSVDKMTYKLCEPIKKDYGKIGTLLFPVYETQSDKDGSFFVPIRNFGLSECNYVCETDIGKKTIKKSSSVGTGKRVSIDLI